MTVAVQERASSVPAQPQGELIDPAGELEEFDELEDPEDMRTVSVRITKDVHTRLKRLARARGDKYTRMLREWIDLELASAENRDEPVTREQALRAVQALRELGYVA